MLFLQSSQTSETQSNHLSKQSSQNTSLLFLQWIKLESTLQRNDYNTPLEVTDMTQNPTLSQMTVAQIHIRIPQCHMNVTWPTTTASREKAAPNALLGRSTPRYKKKCSLKCRKVRLLLTGWEHSCLCPSFWTAATVTLRQLSRFLSPMAIFFWQAALLH